MRTIDADVLKGKLIEMQQVYNEPYEHYDNGFQDAVSQIDDALDNLPTIDPIKHGEWVEDICFDERFICNSCGNEAYMDFDEGKYVLFDYCPNCGAKMGGDKE